MPRDVTIEDELSSAGPSLPRSRPRPDADRCASLTGLRGVAALLVVTYHLVGASPELGRAGTAAVAWGYLPVGVFFVLSGFVLSWSRTGPAGTRAFLRRRFARLAPLYLLTLLVCVLVRLAPGGPPEVDPPPLADLVLHHLTLTQGYVRDPLVAFGLNGPGWSLACEALFYALFPLIVRGLRRLPVRLVLAPAALLWLGWVTAMVHAPGPVDQLWLYTLPPMRLAEFTAGCGLAFWIRAGRPVPRWPLLLLVLAAALAVIHSAVTGMKAPALGAWLAAPGAVALVGRLALADLALRPAGPGVRVLRSRPAQVLGGWSFAVYLCHHPVLQVLGVAGLPPGWVPGWPVALVLIVAVSAAVATWVDPPAGRWVGRRLDRGATRARAIRRFRRGGPRPGARPGPSGPSAGNAGGLER